MKVVMLLAGKVTVNAEPFTEIARKGAQFSVRLVRTASSWPRSPRLSRLKVVL